MKNNIRYGKITNFFLIPFVALALVACESSNDSGQATWNRSKTTTDGGTSATEAPATNAGADNSGQDTYTPSTSGTPVAGDAIDPGSIEYLHANVAGWPVTSKLRVSISKSTITLNYDKANKWPSKNGVNANPWIIVNRNGKWTAATWEWLRPGQTSKPTRVVEGGHIKKKPLNDFRPVSGEVYGWMVTSLARDKTRSVNERTNIVLARWP